MESTLALSLQNRQKKSKDITEKHELVSESTPVSSSSVTRYVGMSVLILFSFISSFYLENLIENNKLFGSNTIGRILNRFGISEPYCNSSLPEDICTFDDEEFMQQYVCNKKHGFRMSTLARSPQMFFIGDFLAPGEAEHIRLLAEPKFSRSGVVSDEATGETMIHSARNSFTAFLDNFGADPVIDCVMERASSILQLPVRNLESLQVVRYRKGERYQPHHDHFEESTVDPESGNRVATIFAYLNEVAPEHGGYTAFPQLNLAVPAVKNAAALWYNLDIQGQGEPDTLHAGAPVTTEGVVKYGLNIWIRENGWNQEISESPLDNLAIEMDEAMHELIYS